MSIGPGQTVGDSYLLERCLGVGGMGSVYLARDTQLDRQVAIKLLHEDVSLDAEADARFQREAQVMSRVVHPNVVAVYGFGRHEGAWYIAMEHVEGETLEELLERQDSLSLQQAVTIAKQVACGLAEAHAHGIVHRDIKPANILLRQLASGALLAKVVDFGLARAFADQGDARDSVTDRAKILGTPAYMAPEQIQNSQLDGATDQYALAVMFYQMCTGNLPIYRSTVQGILLAHMVDDPQTLELLGETGIRSQALDRVVRRSLAKRAEDRFDDVITFATALERASGIAIRVTNAAVSCPSCGHLGREGAAFCERCGSAVPLSSCPACGTERHGERYFCSSCNTSLLSSSRHVDHDTSNAHFSDSVTAALLVASVEGDGESATSTNFFASFGPLVEREGGRPLAQLGSECIAAFGLGGMREREVESAIDTALTLHRLFDRLKGLEVDVTLHVGITVGTVRTRGLGCAWGTAYAVGPAMQASRAAASAARSGEVLVTKHTWREVRDVYAVEEASEGLVRIIKHAEVSHALKTQQEGAFASGFIIRSSELDDLLQTAERVTSTGRMHVVPVLGEAGSGKSRLLGELIERLSNVEQKWQIDAARCSSMGVSIAYEPFVEILRARTGEHADTKLDVSSRLAALPGLRPFEGSNEQDQRAKLASLERLLGVNAAQTLQLGAARPATAAEQATAFDAVASYVEGACQQQPVLMLIADLQWAKDTTLSLLTHIIRTCNDLPLLLVLPMRAERSEELLSGLGLPLVRTRPIDLPPLEAQSAKNMVRAMLGGIAVPESLCGRIHAFAQGVPGRIVEAVEALVRQGVLQQTADGWSVVELDGADKALDRPLDSIILSRIGRLPPGERALLQAVALAGAYAPLGMISAMLMREVPSDELELALGGGYLSEERNPHFASQREISVRHKEVADLVSKSLSSEQRAQLHGRAAQWLTNWRGRRPAGFGALLAHHFMYAGDQRNAAQFMVKTAVEALRSFANKDAYDAFSAAIQMSEEWLAAEPEEANATVTLVEALLGRAEVGVHLGLLAEARVAAERAEDFIQQDDDEATLQRARALIVQGEVATRFGEYNDALTAFGFAALVGNLGPRGSGLAAIATGRRALVLYRSGEVLKAATYAKDALTRFRNAAPTPDVLNGLGRLHTVIGHVSSRQGNYEKANESYETGRALHRDAGDEIGAAMLTLSLGNSAYRSGDLAQAERSFTEAAATCERFDYLQGECNARNNLAYVLIDRGQTESALTQLLKAERKMRGSGLRDILPDTLRLISRCRLHGGNTEAAIRAASEAIELAKELGNEGLLANAMEALEAARHQASDPSAKTTVLEVLMEGS